MVQFGTLFMTYKSFSGYPKADKTAPPKISARGIMIYNQQCLVDAGKNYTHAPGLSR